MKLEVGKKYTDGRDFVDVKFIDYENCAWGLDQILRSRFIEYSNVDRWQEVTDKPDPGEGWRLLEPDEEVHVGDEWLTQEGRWIATVSEGFKPNEYIDLTVRRRIKPDPGEGWRLLEPDEDLQFGDEIFLPDAHPFDDWNRVEAGNNKQTPKMFYRRRIAPQYAPYTWEDREELRDRWFKQKGDVSYERKVCNIEVEKSELFIDGWEAKEFLQKCVWLDGSPCGKKVV